MLPSTFTLSEDYYEVDLLPMKEYFEPLLNQIDQMIRASNVLEPDYVSELLSESSRADAYSSILTYSKPESSPAEIIRVKMSYNGLTRIFSFSCDMNRHLMNEIRSSSLSAVFKMSSTLLNYVNVDNERGVVSLGLPQSS